MFRRAKYSGPPKRPADCTARNSAYSRTSAERTRVKDSGSAEGARSFLFSGTGWRRLYKKPKRKGVNTRPTISFHKAVERRI